MNMEHPITGFKDQFFKGQQQDEKFVCFFRHHWFDLMREFIYFAIFVAFIITSLNYISEIQEFLRGNREMKFLFLAIFLGVTFYLHRFFINLLDYFTNIGIITDRRIIDHEKTLFFIDNLDSIELSQIQNIEKIEDGLLPNLLKYGDIKIFLNASATVKTFHRVPNAKFHFRCINREREIRQHSLMRGHGDLFQQNQPELVIPQTETTPSA
ncbi:hypothetical protein HY604_02190 [Candidatus Peregrinibacteria bacterium]|nr:hypothetical protein [Candidatus Peregrinibacteria bacterium]